MGWCPGCGADLDTIGVLSHVSDVAPTRRRPVGFAVAAVGLALAAVAGLAVLAVLVTAGRDGRRPLLGHLAKPIRDPLRHPSRPTESVIVGAKGNTLTAIHLDSGLANTVVLPSAHATGDIFKVVSVGDTAVVLRGDPSSGGQVWVVGPAALAGRAPPLLLGAGVDALAPPSGNSPPSVSIVTRDTAGQYAVHIRALDGRSLTTTVAIPHAAPLASVLDGYLVSPIAPGPPQLHIFEPGSGTLIRQIGAGQSPMLIAAANAHIAWRDAACQCGINFFDHSNDEVTSVGVPGYFLGYEGDQAAMPADGTVLAVGLERVGQVGFAVDVVDAVSGKSTITTTAGPANGLAWSSDGTRLFISDGTNVSVAARDGTGDEELGPFVPWAVLKEVPAA